MTTRLWLIEKSNSTGRWTGRNWIVESHNESFALSIGKARYPSKNATDEFHATLIFDGFEYESAARNLQLAAGISISESIRIAELLTLAQLGRSIHHDPHHIPRQRSQPERKP